MRAIGRAILSFLPSLLVFLALLEVGLQAAARTGLLPLSLPSYSLARARPFWGDVDPDWGVWRLPNAEFRHLKSCFDVSYRSNLFGMRDADTAMLGETKRVVVLGDSFVEGWGVAYGARFTERLEALTGREHLNFGTSGDFGTTQAMVLYERFASRFSHDSVIWAILPANDFNDDLPTPERLAEGARWRPYLTGDAPPFTLRYPAGRFEPRAFWGKYLENIPREFLITVRAWFYLEKLLETRAVERRTAAPPGGRIGSMYWDYEPTGFARLSVAAERIRAAAGARPLLIVTIPRPNDFARTQAEAAEPPLRRALADLARGLGADYLDLLEPMSQVDWSGFYLSCDGHWTEAGHAFAAARIAERPLTARPPGS